MSIESCQDRKRGKSNLRFFGVGHSVQVAVLNAGVLLLFVVVSLGKDSLFWTDGTTSLFIMSNLVKK